MMHSKQITKIRMPVDPALEHFGNNVSLLSRQTQIGRRAVYAAIERGHFNDAHTRRILAATGDQLAQHIIEL